MGYTGRYYLPHLHYSLDYSAHYQALPRAFGTPILAAVYKQSPNDFIVREHGGFVPADEGDHLALRIEKINRTTHDIVQDLCRHYAVAEVDVGYSGQKDKRAITEQWFTVHLPGLNAKPLLDVTPPSFPSGTTIKQQHKHNRKLRHGTHTGNYFEVVLRQIEGPPDEVQDRIDRIQHTGFPNYFGEQRFGIGHRNLVKAETLFREITSPQRSKRKRISRAQRSLYLSAARSFLFNEVLAYRIKQDNWLDPQPDEPLILDGSRSYFRYQQQPDIADRLTRQDIHTSGPLWGAEPGDTVTMAAEAAMLSNYPLMTQGLERAGVDAARRPLRCIPAELTRKQNEDTSITLSFSLPPGAFATALLRELMVVREEW